ncbi:MAG: hypothetical protein ABIN57_06950 [Chitinophagaceae bacterium]
MGLLTPKDKKGDKKNNTSQKATAQGSKFLASKGGNTKGFTKKQMPGSANRGS